MHCAFYLRVFILSSLASICESALDPSTLEELSRKRLSLKDFAAVLHTEIEDELDIADRDVETFWGALIEYTWNENHVSFENDRANDGSSYIICSETSMSGLERVDEVKDAIIKIDDTVDVSSLGGDSTSYILLNTNSKTCISLELNINVAVELAKSGSFASFHPNPPQAKMVGGTSNTLKDLFKGNEDAAFPEIVINFCENSKFFNRTLDDESDIYSFLTSKEESERSFWLFIGDKYDNIRTVKNARAYWSDAVEAGIGGGDDACKDLLMDVKFSVNPFDGSFNVAIPSDILTTAKETGVTAECALSLLLNLSLLNDVCGIEIVKPLETSNAQAQWLVQSGIENKRPWFDAGIDGEGQVVQCSDTGIDVNNCYFWDNINGPVIKDGSVDLNQRKVVQYMPYADRDDQELGHGTHCAGTIAGKRAIDGISESRGLVDGVAPGAKLAFFDMGLSDGSLKAPNPGYLLQFGLDAGAKLHSASWGGSSNGYGSLARGFDDFLYKNDEMLAVIAAGNSGGGDTFDSVGEPSTAKNVLAVGAGHSYGDDLRDGQLGVNYIASFSSRGRTSDSRTKPDVIAPGKYILSAGARPSEVGECDPNSAPKAGGNSKGVESMAGTSMATPVTAGTAALIRQYFVDGYYPSGEKNEANSRNPSGALVKAVIMNGAQYMTGVDNGDGDIYPTSPYDDVQNFGRISLIDSLYIKGKSNIEAFVDEDVVAVGDSVSHTLGPINGTCNSLDVFSATLVWFDPPASAGCTHCILNDLDLKVEKLVGESVTNTFYPNGASGPTSRNNAERVRVNDVKAGDVFKVTVTAQNLITRRQKYALVVTACFGGTENILGTGRDVFKNDNSASSTAWSSLVLPYLCAIGLVAYNFFALC